MSICCTDVTGAAGTGQMVCRLHARGHSCQGQPSSNNLFTAHQHHPTPPSNPMLKTGEEHVASTQQPACHARVHMLTCVVSRKTGMPLAPPGAVWKRSTSACRASARAMLPSMRQKFHPRALTAACTVNTALTAEAKNACLTPGLRNL